MMSQQWDVAAKKASVILGCIGRVNTNLSHKILWFNFNLHWSDLMHSIVSNSGDYCSPTGASPEKSNKNDQGVENKSYQERWRKLGMFNLEKRRLRSATIAVFNTWRAVKWKKAKVCSLLPQITKLWQEQFDSGTR